MLDGMVQIMQAVLESTWTTIMLGSVFWLVIFALAAEWLGLFPEGPQILPHDAQGRPYDWAVDGL